MSDTTLIIPPVTSQCTSETTVTNYITEIMGAVSLQDKSICGNCCEEGSEPTSRCNECNDFLCDTCVDAHERLRLTKDHRIVRFTSNQKNRSESLGYSSGASSPHTINAIQIICDIHKDQPHRLYCETCHVSACTECTVNNHHGHNICYLENAIEEATQRSFKLITEIKTALTAVNEGIEKVQLMYNRVNMKLCKASSDINLMFNSYSLAIERRKEELLAGVDQIRGTKENNLMTQIENLRIAHGTLIHIHRTLNDSLESPDILDLIPTSKRVANELKKVRSIKSELQPCEDDNINFIAPDLNHFRAVNQLGKIHAVVNSPPIIRVADLPIDSTTTTTTNFSRYASLPSRPIYGASNLVSVNDTGTLPSLIFGVEGSNDGQLCRPWGICCNSFGHILIADRSNNRVQIFDSKGKFLFKFGRYGKELGEFDRPAGITINLNNNIIVSDKDNHRVQVFKSDGTFIFAFGKKGASNGEFNYPWDVATNSQSQIVVSDTRNHRIQLFTKDGVFINKYGFESSSAMWKHFDSPRGVCFTPQGSIIVTDFNNHRLVIVDKYLNHAQFLGGEGSHNRQFLRPQGVLCDDQGRIIVADSRNNRIQVIDTNGAFLWKIGQAGKNSGEFDRPTGICLNPDGRIVVIDFGNTRVQIF